MYDKMEERKIMYMKTIFDEILKQKSHMLAVLPTYEDFEDFAKEQGINYE